MNIGIDIGGSHIGIGLVQKEKIIDKKEIEITSKNKENIEEFIVESIQKNISKILEKNSLKIKDIEKIGIATPGTVINEKIITNVVNLKIKEFDLWGKLKNHYKNTPIIIKNDGKCAATAEKLYGNMSKYEDAIFICLGTGVGGAVFLGGKMLEPQICSGFEIGHMTINKDGIACNCGKNGCFDIYGSMKRFKRKIIKELNLNETAISSQILPAIQKSQNEKIQEIIEEYTKDIAIGISNLINIFEPQIVVIGGSFAHYKDLLLEKVKQKIQNENMLLNKREKLNITTAKLLNDAGIIGAGNL